MLEAYSESSQTKIELFKEIVFWALTIFAESSVLGVRLVSEYISESSIQTLTKTLALKS